MVERINLTIVDSGLERIRSRGDRSDRREEDSEEGVKNALTTLFGTCVDSVLLTDDDDDDSLSAFGNRCEQ